MWKAVSFFCAAYFFGGIALLAFPLSHNNVPWTLVLVALWIIDCFVLRYANRRW